MDLDKCIMTCIHYCGIIQNSFIVLKNPHYFENENIIWNYLWGSILSFSVPGIQGFWLNHPGHLSACLHYHSGSVNIEHLPYQRHIIIVIKEIKVQWGCHWVPSVGARTKSRAVTPTASLFQEDNGIINNYYVIMNSFVSFSGVIEYKTLRSEIPKLVSWEKWVKCLGCCFKRAGPSWILCI